MTPQVQRAAPGAAARVLARAGPVAGATAALIAVAVLAWERSEFQLGLSAAVWDALRATAAAGVLFGACGYAPARLLAPAGLRAHAGLLAFPLGAVVSALALTALGLLHVPFGGSLPL